jgi:hypothetical protein
MSHPLDYPPPPSHKVSTPRRRSEVPLTHYKAFNGLARYSYVNEHDSPVNPSKSIRDAQQRQARMIAQVNAEIAATTHLHAYADQKNRIIDDFAIWLADNCGEFSKKTTEIVIAIFKYFNSRNDEEGWILTWCRANWRWHRRVGPTVANIIQNYWNNFRKRTNRQYLPDQYLLTYINTRDMFDSQVLIKPYSEIDIRSLNT